MCLKWWSYDTVSFSLFLRGAVVVVGSKANCPLVGPGPVGGMPCVGGLSKGS